jgi:hypothetical protein
VQNNTTNQQASVANNTINAELTAQQSDVAAESQGLTTEFNYLTQVNNNQTAQNSAVLNAATKGGNGGIFYGQSATTDEALLSALSLGEGGTGTVTSAENSLGATGVAVQNAGASTNAALIGAITGGIGSAFTGLFG